MKNDEQVLDALYKMIKQEKRDLFEKIAADRTRHLTVALESIQKDHNASAVLRSCDCFGIQDLYAIEKGNQYTLQREIARGAGKWVDLHPYTTGENPTLACLNDLRAKGYQIVATSPRATITPENIPIDKPMALFFGTEWYGISNEVDQLADYHLRIPMVGFTESFNVSVSVAITLHVLRNRLENSSLNWKLNPHEQTRLKLNWASKIIRNGELVEQELRKRLFEKD